MTQPEQQHPIAVVPDGSVIITPAQQYAELQATRRAVEQLTSKVDPALQNLREDVTDLRKGHDKHSDELAALQKWRWMVTGALTLLGALVGWGLINWPGIGG